MMEPQIGDIYKFDQIKFMEPVHVLIEDIEQISEVDKIIHFRYLETGNINAAFIHTFLNEKPKKVA